MDVLDFFLLDFEYHRRLFLFDFRVVYEINPKDTKVIKTLTEDFNLLMDRYFGILTIKEHIVNGTKFGKASKETLDGMLEVVMNDIEERMEMLAYNYKEYPILKHRITQQQRFYYELLTMREKYAS